MPVVEGTIRIGIDLGGTKIEGVAINGPGIVVAQKRIAAPRENYQATIAAISELVRVLVEDASEKARGASHVTVGIGIPGSLSPATGRVQNANSTWLNGQALDRDLEVALGRPVRLANDANCFALSEAIDGAGAGARTVFGVIIGTGVGGGLVISGSIVDGPRGIGGEWGHNPLPWPAPEEIPGPQCWCGRRGCMEAWASGPAMARDHQLVNGEAATAEKSQRMLRAVTKKLRQRLSGIAAGSPAVWRTSSISSIRTSWFWAAAYPS